MTSRRRVLMMAMAALVWTACARTDSQEAPNLRFSAIPDQTSTELQEKFQPFSDYLSRELGVAVKYVPARDYQASVEMFKNGDVLLSWFGGLTGVQARQAVAGSRAIAQGAADPEYYSYFIAHQETGLEFSDDFPAAIADLRFTFGSESSTSGRLMPEYFISQRSGQHLQDFFTHPVGFSGSHDKTAELVETGQYQAGVINYKVYDRRVEEGKTNPDVCRIIWKTPLFADYNWTAHPELETVFGDGFTDRLQQALIQIDDPRLLIALPRHRLVRARNEDFEGIREVAEKLDMLR